MTKRDASWIAWVSAAAMATVACAPSDHLAADAGSVSAPADEAGKGDDGSAPPSMNAGVEAGAAAAAGTAETSDATPTPDATTPKRSADASAGDASSTKDAAVTRAPDAAVGAPCGGPGMIVCDDFEDGGLGMAPSSPWTVAKNAGSVTIDRTRAFSGEQSVKITAPSSTGFRTVMLRLTGSTLPPAGDVIYGRMMFWLDSAPTSQIHWTFIDSSGLVPGTNYHAVYRYGGQIPITAGDGGFGGSQMMASYDTPDSNNGNGPASDCWHHSMQRAVPIGAWSCAQWKFDGPNATLTFSLDGVPADDLTVAQTGDGCISQPATYVWTAPSFQQVDLGWEAYQADTDTHTIWLDDVAVGTAPIDCP